MRKINFMIILFASITRVADATTDATSILRHLEHIKAEVGFDQPSYGIDSEGQKCTVTLIVDKDSVPANPKKAILVIDTQKLSIEYTIDTGNQNIYTQLNEDSIDHRIGFWVDLNFRFYLKTVKIGRGMTFEYRDVDSKGNFGDKFILCGINIQTQ